MSLFANHVNLGVNELWYNALRDYKPYQDRLRSTNVREFTHDTSLDVKPTPFVEAVPVAKDPFVPDTRLSGGNGKNRTST